MTDAALVAKKLAQIDTLLQELRSLGRVELLKTDVREERFLCHTLQMALQTMLDIASHIVSDDRLGEPQNLGELFELLARGGWVPVDLVSTLRSMAGFRNVLVHEYARLDLDLVEDLLQHRLGDLERFTAAVRQQLG